MSVPSWIYKASLFYNMCLSGQLHLPLELVIWGSVSCDSEQCEALFQDLTHSPNPASIPPCLIKLEPKIPAFFRKSESPNCPSP